MASINRINLAGNLTGDPEFTTTDGGLAVARFGLAVSRGYAVKDDGADFFTVVVWKGLAEAVAEHKSKGDAVAIEGRIDYSRYEDAEGRKRSRTRVVAHDVQFIDSAGNGINRLVLLGNLTRDPEMKHVTVADVEGVPVTTFGLAMDRIRSQKEDAADFVEVECWRELGEIVRENKKRGHGVLVTGRLAHDRWKNSEGEARSKIKVVADAVQFTTTAQGKGQGKGQSNGGGRSHRSGPKDKTADTNKKQYQSRYSK